MSVHSMTFANESDLSLSFATKDNINKYTMNIYEFFQNLDYNYQRPLLPWTRNVIQDNLKYDQRGAQQKSNLTQNSQPIDNQQKICYGQKPKNSELAKITDLRTEIYNRNKKQPDGWTNGDILRYLNNSNQNMNEAIKNIEKNINWTNSIYKDFCLTEKAGELLKEGHFYIGGRSKLGHPIMVISFANLEIDEDLDEHAEIAFLFVLMTMNKYMMIGKYCESYHVFIDFDGINSKPNHNFFKKIEDLICTNFQYSGIKLWIYNSHWCFSTSQKVLKITTKKSYQPELIYLKPNNMSQFLEEIVPKEWEKRFGGESKDYQRGGFWPPRDFNRRKDRITKQDILDYQLHAFWIFDIDKDAVIWKVEWHQAEINQKLWMKRQAQNQVINRRPSMAQALQGMPGNKMLFEQNLENTIATEELTMYQRSISQEKRKKSLYENCMSALSWCCVTKAKADEEKARKIEIDNVKKGLFLNEDENHMDADSFRMYEKNKIFDNVKKASILNKDENYMDADSFGIYEKKIHNVKKASILNKDENYMGFDSFVMNEDNHLNTLNYTITDMGDLDEKVGPIKMSMGKNSLNRSISWQSQEFQSLKGQESKGLGPKSQESKGLGPKGQESKGLKKEEAEKDEGKKTWAIQVRELWEWD